VTTSRAQVGEVVYLDTSAFVKLIIDEDGAADARAWFFEAQLAASSVITYPEASSTLGRREREGGSSGTLLRSWVAALEERWRRTLKLSVAERAAGRLAIAHRLRGMDAVQLAAAMTLRERLRAGAPGAPGAEVAFAAFDRRLLEAAEREGFATLGRPLA
jgi:uncharacterized protein